jgi:hypothetical protein
MSELFLLVAMMAFSVFVMGVMIVAFRGWFKRREEIEREAGRL